MLGDRLRELRRQHGLTLRDVAARTGLSVAMLSQIENGRTDPSITSLRKLARVFDAEVATLFHEPDAPSVHVSRPGERFLLSAPAGLIAYERLTPGRGDLEVLRSELEPGDVSAESPRGHASTECVYVLSGEIVVTIGDQDHRLVAGEAATFDSRQPHRYVNASAERAAILVIVTPPTP